MPLVNQISDREISGILISSPDRNRGELLRGLLARDRGEGGWSGFVRCILGDSQGEDGSVGDCWKSRLVMSASFEI